MKVCARLCLIAGAIGLAPFSLAQDVSEQSLVDSVNAEFRLTSSELVDLDVVPQSDGTVSVSLPLDGELYTLQLAPHSVRAPSYRVLLQVADGSWVNVPAGPERTLRGQVMEYDGSIVAGALEEHGLQAQIVLADGSRIQVEPVYGRVDGVRPSMHVVFRNEQILPNGGHCGVTDSTPVEDVVQTPGGNTRAGLFTAELACDVDVEYYNRYGSITSVENRVNNVVNNANIQYERDVEITHVITTILIRSAEPDPYTSTDPGTLLDQFRDEWINNQTGIQRDVAHLFTGKSLAGSVIGIAWTIGGICTSSGYCLSEADCCGSLACASDLVAHELGHLWGGQHCTCSNSTMNPSITCTQNFNATSQGQITAHRDSRSCLDECQAGTILSQPQSQDVCSGEQAFFTVASDVLFPAYQWRKGTTDLVDGPNIIGSQTAALIILSATEDDEATNYKVVITDIVTGCETTSENAELTVGDSPSILSQPANQTVDAGAPAFFTTSTTEPTILFTFQWRRNGVNLTDSANIIGSQSTFLLVVSSQEADEGTYDCVVTRIGDTCDVATNGATLSVNAPSGCANPQAGCDASDIFPVGGDCIVDLSDLGNLLSNFGAAGTRDDGDVFPVGTGDGLVDLSDLGQMLSDYGTDCN